MIRFGVWTVVGILAGLVVHLGSLLALPSVATQGAFQRLTALGPEARFPILPVARPGRTLLPSPDPSVRMAACWYDLSKGPLEILAKTTGAFVSVSFYSADGLNFYALNDRAASNGEIALTVYTSLQLADVRAREGPDTPQALRIEAPADRGVVLVRALVPSPAAVTDVERRLGEAQCRYGEAPSPLLNLDNPENTTSSTTP